MFSIVIPTYNRLSKLMRAVDSVLNQSFQGFELIIVDDGSTDRTQEYVESIQDARVSYVWQSNSGLPSVARNKGISKATEPWVCFLDSDDWWMLNKLEEIHRIIKEHPDCDVVSHNELITDASGNPVKSIKHTCEPGKETRCLLETRNFLSPSAIAIKREKLEELNGFNISEAFWSVEDFELWIRLSRIATFAYIDKDLGYCFVDGTGISSELTRHMNCMKNVFIEHADRSIVDKRIFMVDSALARLHLKQREFGSALSLSVQLIKDKPIQPKPWIILLLSMLRISV